MELRSIDAIARQICIQEDDPNFTKLAKIMALVRVSVGRLKSFGHMGIDVHRFDIDGSLSYDLPHGYQSEVKLGMVTGCGRIERLTKDGLEIDKECTCQQDTPVEQVCPSCSWSSTVYGNMYGYIPGRLQKGYRIDQKNNKIVFTMGLIKTGDTVYMEYISNTVAQDLMVVPEIAYMFIYYEVKGMLDPRNIRLWRQQAGNELRIVNTTLESINMHDVIAAFRKGYINAARR